MGKDFVIELFQRQVGQRVEEEEVTQVHKK
jgi:hypothetical protein